MLLIFMKGYVYMETYEILRDLAVIFISAKLFGLLARKCKAPM